MKCLFMISALLGAAVPSLLGQNTCPVQNGTLNGTYVLSGTGSYGGSPIALVGKAVFDGAGNLTLTFSASVNGVIYRGLTATGTYNVNADCTGSKTFTDSMGNTTHYDFVVAPDGNKLTWIETDSFTSVLGNAVRFGQ